MTPFIFRAGDDPPDLHGEATQHPEENTAPAFLGA